MRSPSAPPCGAALHSPQSLPLVHRSRLPNAPALGSRQSFALASASMIANSHRCTSSTGKRSSQLSFSIDVGMPAGGVYREKLLVERPVTIQAAQGESVQVSSRPWWATREPQPLDLHTIQQTGSFRRLVHGAGHPVPGFDRSFGRRRTTTSRCSAAWQRTACGSLDWTCSMPPLPSPTTTPCFCRYFALITDGAPPAAAPPPPPPTCACC